MQGLSYESLIRAYFEHWQDVPKPLDSAILEAVRFSMQQPPVRTFRVEYHQELLRLAAGAE